MDKIGRNDPCPCGSGKKHKHCCLGKTAVPNRFTDDDRRSALDKLDRFVERTLGAEDDAAYASFYAQWADRMEELDDEETEISEAVFDMWCLFDHKLPTGNLVVDVFLEKGPLLVPGERRYLRLMRETALRLYEVEDLLPGKSVTFVDLLSGVRVKVHERTASRSLWRHALLAARIIQEDPSGQPEIEAGILNIPELSRDGILLQLSAHRGKRLRILCCARGLLT